MTKTFRQLRDSSQCKWSRTLLAGILLCLSARTSLGTTLFFEMPLPGGGSERVALYSRLTAANLNDVCWRYLPHRGDFGGKGVAIDDGSGRIRVGFLGRTTVAHHADALPLLGGKSLDKLDRQGLARVTGIQFQAHGGQVTAMQWDSRITRRQTGEQVPLARQTIARLNRALLDAVDSRILASSFPGIDSFFLEKTSNAEKPFLLVGEIAARDDAGRAPGAQKHEECLHAPAPPAGSFARPSGPLSQAVDPLEFLLVRLTGLQLERLLEQTLEAWVSGEWGVSAASFAPDESGYGLLRTRTGSFTRPAQRRIGPPRAGVMGEVWSRVRRGELEISAEGWSRLRNFSKSLPGQTGVPAWLESLSLEAIAAARLRKLTVRALAWLDCEGRGPVFRPKLAPGSRTASILATSDGVLTVPADCIPDSDDPLHPLTLELARRLVYEMAPFFGPFSPRREANLLRAERVLDRMGVPAPPEGLDLWLRRSNPPELGLALARLTLDPAYDEFPAVSPDGRYLAFCRLLSSPRAELVRKGIFVLDLVSGRVRHIETGEGSAMQPAWSPDGRWLAFRGENIENRNTVEGRSRGDFDVRLVPSTGGEVKRLTHSPADEKHPQFSPDGRSIAFYANRETSSHQIFVMAADGSNLRRLTSGEANRKHPSWSPDGRRILFHANGRVGDSGKTLWDVYSMAADGSDERRLTATEDGDRHPFISGDGRWVAFHTNRGHLRLLPLGAGQDAGPIQELAEQATGYFRDPFWFPGEHRLVLMRVFDHTRASLYALDLSDRIGAGAAIGR